MTAFSLLRPLIFAMDAERAHRATIAMLRALPARRPPAFPDDLRVRVAGLDFPTPVGLAAGFDKDAQVSDAMLGLGFGFVEVGTTTPLPQPGNPRPRLFRLARDRAVINRMGFNNQGQAAALERLRSRDHRRGIVGVNVGANKDSADRIADYAQGIRRMAPVADYLAVNISSPNTPGLRTLQDAGELDALLGAVADARPDGGPPIFLKVAPDLSDGDPDRIARAVAAHGLDGIIVANTTVSRPPLRSLHADQAGGLSGAPLAPIALAALKTFRAATGGTIPLIAAGGIGNAQDAWQRIRAGASLVQIYSAMVFEGPGLAARIAAGLSRLSRQAGYASVSQAIGADAPA